MSTIPLAYQALVDDAAMFPPGSVDLDLAVAAYRGRALTPYAEFVGPLVVSDLRLPEVIEILSASGTDPGTDAGTDPRGTPLPVTVVVTGGAGGIEPAARWGGGSAHVDLRSLEIALRDTEDLVANARRVVAAADLGLDLDVYVEMPVQPVEAVGSHGWLAALDVVAEADLRVKFRTGGGHADQFPTSTTVATCLDSALDRELPFKFTSGLHRAVRHTDKSTGCEMQGFLNLFLATRAALDGGDVVAVLEETDAEVVVDCLAEAGDSLARTRRWFTSFGCCGVLDPLEELLELGLIDAGAVST